MSFGQSLLVALFCITVVFSVLLVLWGTIRLITAAIKSVEHAPSTDEKQV